ncbi:MAG: MurT ligase domain-containing protein [Propionibacteriaceae bacterium]|jgi:UDP-N-acetylmuramyl tripeptide synthase|nr:MurT ligase domain-containing protein [Propionibacteriaceae bacterium]
MPADLRRAQPAELTLGQRARLRLATLAGEAAAVASRAANKGSGASIKGQVLTRLCPDAFAWLLRGRRVLAVSGTNGKTTTTHLLAAAVAEALGDQADRLVTNADGANLRYGIASALSQDRRADIAVLETDERVVSDMIAQARPEVLVFLNFSRDQLDRHHEIKALGKAWRAALERAGQAGPVVVGNASDPLVVWSAQTAARVVWVDTPGKWNADSALCPACGAVLERVAADTRAAQGCAEAGGSAGVGRTRDEAAAGAVPVGEAGTGESGGGEAASETGLGPSTSWRCPECPLAQPEAEYRVRGGEIVLPDGRAVVPGLRVPGSFNVSNAALALAAAAALGIDPDAALRGMRRVEAPAGRFATARFGATTARLMLAKNPAGWAEAIALLESDPVVLAIDSVAADGKDVSWLWDVDYEQLAGRRVVCTGPRAQDLAVRLGYADVSHTVAPDLAEALAGVAGPATVDVIATYTPFQKLLKMAGLR